MSASNDDQFDPQLTAELLGMIVHDLRNPLSALHSNVTFLASVFQDVDEDAREALADTRVSCDGLLHIISNLELLGHALCGGQPLALGPLALAPLVVDAVKRAEGAAVSHEVALALDPRVSSLATRVVAHRGMLSRALDNLLHNAIQHSPGDAPIRVSARESDGRAIVLVADAGTPLAEEVRESAFSASGQLVSKGIGGGRYGRGLGLYAAKLAADAAGARVSWVAPEAGGNGFELSLDIA